MPEEPVDPPAEADEGRTFTQADLDRIVAERLAREKAKFSDYDDLKAQAGKLAEIEDANKSELDKLREEYDALKGTVAATEAKAMRAEVAMAKGLTAAQAKRLVGTTLEELEADADEIAEAFPAASGAKPPPSQRPAVADLKGGSDPTSDEDTIDPAKLAASIPRL